MAITNGQNTIGLTATLIDGFHQMPYRLTFQNMDNTDAVYIGNKGVTINNGFKLEKLQTIQIVVNPLDGLYAVSTKAGHKICWLRETL